MTPTFTGRIADWDKERGCGWVESDGQRIFLHWREFSERRKRPEVGDVIRFTAGTGPTGQLCAENAVHLNDGGRLGVVGGTVLAAVILLPSAALGRLVVGAGEAGLLRSLALRAGVSGPAYSGALIVALVLLINFVTYRVYAADKSRAREKTWRISEATLHFLELIGGWPAAFVAQWQLRHKCSKPSFQFVFWLIVFAYELVAFESLNGWRLTALAFGHPDSPQVHQIRR